MSKADSYSRSTYELPLDPAGAGAAAGPASVAREEMWTGALPEPMLLGNVSWFIMLRWLAGALLALLGVVGLFAGDALLAVGLRLRAGWPLVIAALLLLCNLAYFLHARALARRSVPCGASGNLWVQIVLDLLLLTLVVHFLGSLETKAPFLYAVHIALACIFFSRGQSLAVTFVASGLLSACVALEVLGILPPAGVYMEPQIGHGRTAAPGVAVTDVLFAVTVFFVIWYLASRIGATLRARDLELAEKNQRLVAFQVDKTKHMLRTTHELKAPFAAIAANTQLLLKGSYGDLPLEVKEVVERIAARCRRLAHEIQQMLQLANLQSGDEVPEAMLLDLVEILRWSIARVGALVKERKVSIEDCLEPASVLGVEDHVKMLFANLVSNAVSYSREGGSVRISCRAADPRAPVVTIEDQGIGIPRDKLPKIFDDYYRTEEAARHNKDSTGLGLAIVREVAQTHGIRITVESAPDEGTRVTVRWPPKR